MKRTPFLVLVLCAALATVACSPGLTPPGEAKRIAGVVTGSGEGPVQIVVVERCSPRFYFFERCPGKFLGEAKLARPGKFVIEVDPESPTVAAFAFRGDPGVERQCASKRIEVAEAATALELELKDGSCRLP